MDDWMVYSLLKKHTNLLRIMFERYRQLQISLNFKKCIFAIPFGNLLGHIIYNDGICVDPVKTMATNHMEPPLNAKKLK